jgi:hypothetical protein
MKGSFYRRALVAATALTLACGDSTGPSVELTEEQVDDMLSALTAAGGFDMVGSAPGAQSLQALKAVITVSDVVECPNGGNASVSGSFNVNDQTEAFSMTITQGFADCKATSEETGRLWTFNGSPNITTQLSGTVNQTSGATTITGSQTGGIRFSSDLGSGVCNINITINVSEDGNGVASGSISGTMCNHTISIDFSDVSG